MLRAASASPMTAKGTQRRQAIVKGAAELLRFEGPSSVSHRRVAQEVGCSLSATTYYFSGLNDLLEAAARLNVDDWTERALRVAIRVEGQPPPTAMSDRISMILDATLPTDVELLGYYHQLIGAAVSQPVRWEYRTGRHRLNAAVNRVLIRAGVSWPAEVVIAVVDGAAVSALNQGKRCARPRPRCCAN